MRKPMQWLAPWLVAVALVPVVLSAVADAANYQPLATYSVASYEELAADLKYVGEISGNPNLVQGLEGLITFATGGKGVQGLDKSRPWGAVLQVDADAAAQALMSPQETFRAVVFVPVTDLKALLDALRGIIGMAEDVGGGTFQVGQPGQPPMFVKQVGTWAFLAPAAEMLGDVPADPSTLTASLSDKYDVAFRLNAANIPPQLRDMVLMQLNRALEMQMMRQPGEDAAAFAGRTFGARIAAGMVQTILQELEQVTMGFCLDHNSGRTFVDMAVAAKSGTKAAANFASLAQTTTSFAGMFQPDAVLASRCSGNISQQYAAEMKQLMAAVRTQALANIERQGQPAAQAALAKQLLGQLMDVVEATVGRGRFDMAFSLLAAPDALTMLAGCSVAETAKLEDAVKQLVQVAQSENPQVAQMVQLNAETVQQVNLHKLNVPIPPDQEDRDQLVQLIGETAEVVVGFGPEGVYLALGRNATAQLKQAIAQSASQASQTVPPMQVSVDLGNLAALVSQVGDEQSKAQMGILAALLAPAGPKDHITLVASGIPNGVQLRLELEEGILKAVGGLGQAIGGIESP